MNQIWTALAWIGVVAAITAVTLPLAAIILISVASVREEAAHSLSGQPPGWASAMARRLLGYHADPKAARAARHDAVLRALGESEVRLPHARRTLPDPDQQPASGEPGAGTGSPWQRQGAGV